MVKVFQRIFQDHPKAACTGSNKDKILFVECLFGSPTTAKQNAPIYWRFCDLQGTVPKQPKPTREEKQ
jgi:hypothetical protein